MPFKDLHCISGDGYIDGKNGSGFHHTVVHTVTIDSMLILCVRLNNFQCYENMMTKQIQIGTGYHIRTKLYFSESTRVASKGLHSV